MGWAASLKVFTASINGYAASLTGFYELRNAYPASFNEFAVAAFVAATSLLR